MVYQKQLVVVLAPAKLNLSLDVAGLLPNGYHDLDKMWIRDRLRTAAANAFSTGLWFSAATLVWSLAVLFRRRAS